MDDIVRPMPHRNHGPQPQTVRLAVRLGCTGFASCLALLAFFGIRTLVWSQLYSLRFDHCVGSLGAHGLHALPTFGEFCEEAAATAANSTILPLMVLGIGLSPFLTGVVLMLARTRWSFAATRRLSAMMVAVGAPLVITGVSTLIGMVMTAMAF